MKIINVVYINFVLGMRYTLSANWNEHETKFIRIQQNSSWIQPVVESELPGYSFILNGRVKLSIEKCCPLLFVGSHLEGLPINNGCLDIEQKDLRFILSALDYYRLHLLDWKNNIPTDRHTELVICERNQKDNSYFCDFNNWEDTTFQSRVGRVYIFYSCFQRQDVDILLDITLEGKNISYPDTKCLQLDDSCTKFYNHSSMPNIAGQKRRYHASPIKELLDLTINSNCHKYAEELLCYALLPKCQNNDKIFPCKSTCLETIHACTKSAFQNNYFLISNILQIDSFHLLEQLGTFFCNELPENECFKTQPVICPPPPNINHGTNNSTKDIYPVKSIVEYKCRSGYKLDGNGTVTCEYTGKWSEIPKCIIKNNFKNLIIICSVFGAFILIIIVGIVLCWKYRHELSALLYVKYGIKFIQEKEEKREYDAYITYSQHDFGFVKNKLIDPLEELQFKICIPDRDFGPGDFRSQNIVKGVQASKRTIIVLSQNFIDSGWCQFEFAQAHLKMMEDESFRLLLIMIEEPKTLQNTPKLIKYYINSRTYLLKDDKFFWEKLLYQMPKVKKIAENIHGVEHVSEADTML